MRERECAREIKGEREREREGERERERVPLARSWLRFYKSQVYSGKY